MRWFLFWSRYAGLALYKGRRHESLPTNPHSLWFGECSQWCPSGIFADSHWDSLQKSVRNPWWTLALGQHPGCVCFYFYNWCIEAVYFGGVKAQSVASTVWSDRLRYNYDYDLMTIIVRSIIIGLVFVAVLCVHISTLFIAVLQVSGTTFALLPFGLILCDYYAYYLIYCTYAMNIALLLWCNLHSKLNKKKF